MENKKELVKVAFAALLIASTVPVVGSLDVQAHGIVLAAGCGAHGCASDSDDSASNSKEDLSKKKEESNKQTPSSSIKGKSPIQQGNGSNLNDARSRMNDHNTNGH